MSDVYQLTLIEDELRQIIACVASVFEVVDASNDETFFPLAIYTSLEDAKAAIAGDDPNDTGCCAHDDWEDFVTLEIRERAIGPSGHGKCVHRVTWSRGYDAGPEWSRREDQP
jgi:hypothetical protein